jgi:hypothetical protein
MNADRRKRLAMVKRMLEEALERIETCKLEEEASYDQIPLKLRRGRMARESEQAGYELCEAIEDLENAIFAVTAAMKGQA